MVPYSSQNLLLEILADNLKNPHPELMRADDIARRLNMTLVETKQMLRSMHGMGTVESDMDGEYCLITRSGLQWVGRNILSDPLWLTPPPLYLTD